MMWLGKGPMKMKLGSVTSHSYNGRTANLIELLNCIEFEDNLGEQDIHLIYCRFDEVEFKMGWLGVYECSLNIAGLGFSAYATRMAHAREEVVFKLMRYMGAA